MQKYVGDRYVGLSSDTKPTGVRDGALFYETDTRLEYIKISGAYYALSGSFPEFAIYTGQVGALSNYVLRDGSRGFTGVVSGLTPTSSNHLSTKSYVDNSFTNVIQFIAGPSSSGRYTLSGADGIYLVTGVSGYIIVGNTGIGIAVDARSLTGSILPDSNGVYSLGDATHKFNNIYGRVGTYGDTPSTIINDDITTAHISASGDDSNPTLVIRPSASASEYSSIFYKKDGGIGTAIRENGVLEVFAGLVMSGGYISGIATPVASSHAVSKGYLDTVTGSLIIGTGQVLNFDSAVNTLISPLSGAFTGHTGDATIHFTQAQISIPSSQIQNFSEDVDDRVAALLTGVSGVAVLYNDASNILYIGLSGALYTSITGHIGGFFSHSAIDNHILDTNNPHTVTASQVGAPEIFTFTGHTGDSSIHFTQTSISITSSQVSDFGEAVDDRIGTTIVGTTGIGVVYSDASNILTIYRTGLSNDDRSIYVYRTPSSSSRNTITPVGDLTALTLIQGVSESGLTNNVFDIQNSSLTSRVWVNSDLIMNQHQSPTGSTNLVPLGYLQSNYTSSGSFLAYTGSIGPVSGSTSRLMTIDEKQLNVFSVVDFWHAGGNGWTSSVAGTATAYIAQQRYFSTTQNNNFITLLTVDGGTGTTSSNAGVRYSSSRAIYLASGRIVRAYGAVVNTGVTATGRIGFFGDDVAPTSAATPTAGVWFEYCPATSPNWYGYSIASSNISGVNLGVPVADGTFYQLAFRFDDSQVSFYIPNVSGSTLLGTITGSSLPSTSTQKQGALFHQTIKNNAGGSARPHLLLEYFAVNSSTGRWTYSNI